jgi:hypothetical protein
MKRSRSTFLALRSWTSEAQDLGESGSSSKCREPRFDAGAPRFKKELLVGERRARRSMHALPLPSTRPADSEPYPFGELAPKPFQQCRRTTQLWIDLLHVQRPPKFAITASVTVKTKRGCSRLEWQKLRERNEPLDSSRMPAAPAPRSSLRHCAFQGGSRTFPSAPRATGTAGSSTAKPACLS